MKSQSLQLRPGAAALAALWAVYEAVSLGLAWIAADPNGPFASRLSPSEFAYFSAITRFEFAAFGLSTVALLFCAYCLLRGSALAGPVALIRFFVFLGAIAWHGATSDFVGIRGAGGLMGTVLWIGLNAWLVAAAYPMRTAAAE